MPFQPPPPFRLTTPCRNNSSLRPPGPLLPGIHGFPQAEDTRSSRLENLPPPVRVSGRVPFPARQVPGHREQRQATRRMRLFLLLHEAGSDARTGQGVTGYFIPCRRTRPGLQGEVTKEAPAFLG
jgi:hypothetical protein